MDSGIKAKLCGEQINKLTQLVFGTAALEFEELTDGWANIAYRITLPNGKKAALKIAPAPGTLLMRYEAALMQTEVEALRLAAGVVPVPAVIHYDTSKRDIPSDYYFMEWVEGTPYNKIKSAMSDEERAAVERQLGQYSRLINHIEGERFGPFVAGEGIDPDSSWTAAFRRMVQDVLADGLDKGVRLPCGYDEAEREVELRLGVLDEVKTPKLVHWDLWDGNVFVSDGVITGLIDFERAFWGDPTMEFYFGRMAGSSAFRQGYGLSEATISERQRRKLYDFYLDLIILIECAYRGYNNPKHEIWAEKNLNKGWQHLLDPKV